ncbi:N-acyl-D-amino-acid deacylase family protein [Kordiimonas aquimaris]|uniref:N-acyl-D-amino-acid deacylase family protein n=1 Tax=Kordiimonas aquimaris TaxID=707591 RepID=UPI0021D0ECFE|nr:amidohydrolase family protein [Kordiimonas aquimaris]
MRQITLRVLSICICFVVSACSEQPYDYLIRGGLVVDGTGSAGRIADVGIVGDKIVFVGDAGNHVSQHIIDASGMVVSPGFIDPHTHAYGERPDEGVDYLRSYITQGTTTVFSGNDGGGPVDSEKAYQRMTEAGLGANFGLFVGHGQVRRAVVGLDNRKATSEELEQMKELVEKAMKAGALGLSSGLFYAPGSFADTQEVIELAKIAVKYGGVYESHLRDESNYSIGVVGAVREAIEIGREARIPVHIAHIKALGVDVWGQSEEIIEIIEAAHAEGIRVTADQYPWLASGTRVSNALIPRAAMAGGVDALHARLRDENGLSELKQAMAENLRRRGGAESILLTSGSDEWRGLNLGQYAAKLDKAPIDTAVEIVLAGDAKIASFNMNENDVQNFMRQKWVMTSSDGGDGHPRKFASFPQKYRQYVVDHKTLSLEEFIYRSSALTAETFGIKDRGVLREGMKADVLIFDTATYGPVATYEKPDQISKGVVYLWINGQMVIEKTVVQPSMPGQVIKLVQ